MSARDDYPEPAGMHPAQYDQMCDEIDRLRAERDNARLAVDALLIEKAARTA